MADVREEPQAEAPAVQLSKPDTTGARAREWKKDPAGDTRGAHRYLTCDGQNTEVR